MRRVPCLLAKRSCEMEQHLRTAPAVGYFLTRTSTSNFRVAETLPHPKLLNSLSLGILHTVYTSMHRYLGRFTSIPRAQVMIEPPALGMMINTTNITIFHLISVKKTVQMILTNKQACSLHSVCMHFCLLCLALEEGTCCVLC